MALRAAAKGKLIAVIGDEVSIVDNGCRKYIIVFEYQFCLDLRLSSLTPV